MGGISRRKFVAGAATAAASALAPGSLFAAPTLGTQRVTIRADAKIGTVRPELHGHFIEHLGSCVYGGLWVGRNSPIPNIHGYRKQAVEYLKVLGVPVLRWPGRKMRRHSGFQSPLRGATGNWWLLS